MKILVVGCGSIGRRHAANVAQIGEAAVFDANGASAAAVAQANNIQSFDDLDAALKWRPDGVIVATPHTSHIVLAHKAVEAGAHVLIEKPISDGLKDVDKFLARADTLGRRVFVVCNMRFHPAVAALHEHLDALGSVRFARAHYGSYLPDMRPGADYRTLYAAQRAQGGGVILDAIHEIDYLMWLLGPVSAVLCNAGRLGNLDIDVEDYAAITLEHTGGARSEIHLDYLQRFKRRGCELVGSDGTLLWTSEGKQPERCKVELFKAGGTDLREVVHLPSVDPTGPLREMDRAFVGALEGETPSILDGWAALAVLRVALTAHEAARTGKAISLATST